MTCWRISDAKCLRMSEAGALPDDKALQLGALLHIGRDAGGFAVHFLGGNGEFQRVLTTFN